MALAPPWVESSGSLSVLDVVLGITTPLDMGRLNATALAVVAVVKREGSAFRGRAMDRLAHDPAHKRRLSLTVQNGVATALSPERPDQAIIRALDACLSRLNGERKEVRALFILGFAFNRDRLSPIRLEVVRKAQTPRPSGRIASVDGAWRIGASARFRTSDLSRVKGTLYP